MLIVDAVYDVYAVLYTIKTKDSVSEVLTELYSKSYFSYKVRVLAKTKK